MRIASTLVTLVCGCLFLPISALGQNADQETSRKLREQSIYIPYDKLQETFEKDGRGVFVPYERFQELWKAARETETRPAESAPPVKAMITEIDSQAVVEQDVVRVRATAKIDLLTDGWLTVPLRLADAAVLSAKIDNQPARLISDSGGQALLLKKEGREPTQVVLYLEYAKAYTKAPGQNSVSFQAPLAPVNRWKIRVPDRGVKVNVHPMLAATEIPASAADGEGPSDSLEDGSPTTDETVVLAFVGSASSVRIDWTPKTEGATGLDALVSVQTQQQMTIEEGITRTLTVLTYEVSRSELSQLHIEVPADHKVVNVLDANVRAWKVAAEGQIQRLTVDLFQPARQQQRVMVELEKFREDQQTAEIETPTVRALSVGRQRGIVVVHVASGLRAEAIHRAGLSQLDVSEVPSALKQRPVTMSYRYAALPFDLGLRVEKVQPRITVDQLVEAFLEPRKLTYHLVAKYDIQRSGVFELECEIPDGFQIRDVRGQPCDAAVAAVVESFSTSTEDSSRLKINLGSKAQGKVGLAVEVTRALDEPSLLAPTGEKAELALTPPRVAGNAIASAKGRLVLYAPESLRVGTGDLTGLRSISFDEAFEEIPSAAREKFTQLRPTLAFEFPAKPVSAQIQAERRQPHVTARQLLVARINPAVVKYEVTFFFDVRYSGVDALRVDVPAELVEKIRNETRSLRESPREPAPEDVAAGYVAIQFRGDTELLGQQVFRLAWEEPIDELGVGKSVDLDVPRLVPQQVARTDGQVVLVKAETIDVRPKGEATGLDPIDPQIDLMAGTRIPDAAAALEFRDSDWQLTLTATRYQLEMLKHTSIEQSVLRMVVTRSDRVAVQALYRLRSNMQRLEVELPYDVAPGEIEFDTEPLRINGRAVTLERGNDGRTFFLPLVGHAANEPLFVDLRFTMPGNGAELRYPSFPDEPAVQRVNLVAYLPPEREYIGRRGPWTVQMAWRMSDFLQRRFTPNFNVDRLIRDLSRNIQVVGDPTGDFPVDGVPYLFTTLRPQHPDDGALRLWTVDRKVLDAIVLVGFLVLGVTLLARPYVDRLIVVCGGVGALVLLGVFLPALAGQIIDQTLLIAALLVALLWFAVSAMRGIPKLGQLNWRLSSAGAEEAGTSSAPPPRPGDSEASPTATPANASPPPEAGTEGGEHHG